MPQEGKPVNSTETTVAPGSAAQPSAEQTANPSVEVSDNVRSYLKGLGLDGATITPELAKVAEAGMKQKESVSRMSLETEQLKARLASQGKETEYVAPEEPVQTYQTPEPRPQATEAMIGVTDNDLFDLSRTVITDFPELRESAQDGSLFRELRTLGYFTSRGIDKKSTYEFLSAKNAQAQELRELREFKAKYSRPDPKASPIYNAQPGYNTNQAMDKNFAQAVVMSGDTKSPRYQEAIAFLRDDARNSHL